MSMQSKKDVIMEFVYWSCFETIKGNQQKSKERDFSK